jgi:hypothetical protein
MKRLAGLVLSTLLVAGGFLMVPRMAGDAAASVKGPVPQVGPSPTIGVTIPGPLHSPSPTPSPTPSDDGSGGGSGDNNGGGGGNDNPGDEVINPDPTPSDQTPEGGDTTVDKNGPKKGSKKNTGKGKHAKGPKTPDFSNYHPSGGAYSTEKLVAVATRLLALGYSKEEVEKQVYRPFILAGDAAWSNTWGAPRYGPAPGQIRTHEGQDVFCHYGDDVLATIDGMVEYDDGGLGGTIARVYETPNKYWYFAHLSDINNEEHPSGSQVKAGDVIGSCGNSGDAISTPPHVHFGLYINHVAHNPMHQLVTWLHTAELRVLGVVSKATNRRIRAIDRLTLERRFGDAFAPDLAEMKVSGESLWASGSSPATGAFALAEAALQAALSSGTTSDLTSDPSAAALADADQQTADAGAGSLLSQFLTSSSASSTSASSSSSTAPASDANAGD